MNIEEMFSGYTSEQLCKAGEPNPENHPGGCVKDLYCSDCSGICPMNHNAELSEKFNKIE